MRDRLLRWLVPRSRRDRYGDEVLEVFEELRAEARREHGWRGELRAWMSELKDVVRMKFSSGAGRAGSAANHSAVTNGRTSTSRGGPGLPTEIRWAWRGVMARRGKVLVAVSLLAVALAANTFMFAITDALVFDRVPFPEPDRLVTIQRLNERGGTSSTLSPDLIDRWRTQDDLFSGIEGYLSKTTFLRDGKRAEIQSLADVTPGLTSLLDVSPRWGRPLDDVDAARDDVHAVLISASLARERFGDPAAAIGETLQTAAQPLVVVGVMDASFRFPSASVRIWRALDMRGPLTTNFAGVFPVARLAPGVTTTQVDAALAERTRAMTAGLSYQPPGFVINPLPFARAEGGMFFVLLAAGLCLLLTACANIAGLELASAMGRARTYAVQQALGASRASLVRGILLEGALVVSGASVAAAAVSWAAIRVAEPWLAAGQVRIASLSPLTIDARVLAFMAAVAAVAWLLSSLPVVAFASRRGLAEVLKTLGRSAAASRGSALTRRFLTAGQVSLAVLLLSSSLLAVRTFAAMAAVDKGFDPTGIGQLQVSLPVSADREDVLRRLEERLRAEPYVEAVSRNTAPPGFGSPFANTIVEIDGQPAVSEGIRLSPFPVARDYFEILGLEPVRGRLFDAGEPATSIIIPERFARHFFGDENPIGHELRWSEREPWRTIVGVVPQIKTDIEVLTGTQDDFWYVFPARQPAPPRPPSSEIDTGGSWSMAMLLLRADSEARGPAIVRAAEAAVPEYAVSFAYTSDQYRQIFAPLSVAATVVSTFGILSFVVAAAGIYSVMAYLVASRRREMGIRLALGAATSDIRRLVLGSSVRLVVIGALLGLGGTLAAATFARSFSPGVNPADPVSYLAILTLVTLTAILATWHPARQAARVDPAVTLRSE